MKVIELKGKILKKKITKVENKNAYICSFILQSEDEKPDYFLIEKYVKDKNDDYVNPFKELKEGEKITCRAVINTKYDEKTGKVYYGLAPIKFYKTDIYFKKDNDNKEDNFIEELFNA